MSVVWIKHYSFGVDAWVSGAYASAQLACASEPDVKWKEIKSAKGESSWWGDGYHIESFEVENATEGKADKVKT